MKRTIIPALLVLICLAAAAPTLQYWRGNWWMSHGYLGADSALVLRGADTTFHPPLPGIMFDSGDGEFYKWNGNEWSLLSDSVGLSINLANSDLTQDSLLRNYYIGDNFLSFTTTEDEGVLLARLLLTRNSSRLSSFNPSIGLPSFHSSFIADTTAARMEASAGGIIANYILEARIDTVGYVVRRILPGGSGSGLVHDTVFAVDTIGRTWLPHYKNLTGKLITTDSVGRLIFVDSPVFDTAIFSGDGTTTDFDVTISPGFTPSKIIITPTSEGAASALFYVDKSTVTSTQFTVKAAGAVPPSGTDNVTFDYELIK